MAFFSFAILKILNVISIFCSNQQQQKQLCQILPQLDPDGRDDPKECYYLV